MIQVIPPLEDKIDSRRVCIAVVGLGSVGLPLARKFVEAGFQVLGFDRDGEKIARLTRGENTLAHLEPGFVRGLFTSGRFEATASAERLCEADVALIAVPTPLSPRREPDLECVITASNMLALHLRRGALVVLESTSYPGTTRKVVGDVFRARGWSPGLDCWLAYSPEREDPGRKLEPGASVAKLVGGTCARSSDLAQRLYSAAFARVERTSSAEVAEAAKLLENTFRAVNIGLVNELKVVLDALSIDVWEVIEAAATKPFGFMKFTPGPGLGGHCIPIDPHYLEYVAREAGTSSRFIALASEINRSMPHRVVERTRAALCERDARIGHDLGPDERARVLSERRHDLAGRRILILGMAYKPEVDIVTESPALDLIRLFRAEGAEVRYSDPFVPRVPPSALVSALSAFDDNTRSRGYTSNLSADVDLGRDADPGRNGHVEVEGSCLASITLSGDSIAAFDAIVVVTDHAQFDWDLVAEHARLVVDTRNVLKSRMQGQSSYVAA